MTEPGPQPPQGGSAGGFLYLLGIPHHGIEDFAHYPELRWLDGWHCLPGVCLAVACFLLGGWTGLVWRFVVSTILAYHATFAINSLSHFIRGRRYDTPDESRNNLALAVITLGEGWHNHHHYQSSANRGCFWYEIDVSYSALLVLGWLGVVWGIRTPSEKALEHRPIGAAPAPPEAPPPSPRSAAHAPAETADTA
jgi:stearoyl-CoA desaturase (delta-9 desaturase)